MNTKLKLLLMSLLAFLGSMMFAEQAFASYYLAVASSMPQFGDYTAGGANLPCVAGGVGTSNTAGVIGLYAYYRDCSPYGQHFTCVRLKRGGTTTAQACTAAGYWLGDSAFKYVSCVRGASYSLEVLYFHRDRTNQFSSSANLTCRSYA
jgi:hypothetical protein